MGLRINTNVVSLAAQRSLGVNNSKQQQSLERLSSGSRINRASDDAAGLAISEKFKAQIRGLQQAGRNAGDGISMIQTAEGSLNEVSNILTRLRELSMQSASDTVNDTERGFTNLEYQNLKAEVDRISQTTEFNGNKLLDGTGGTYDIQVGINNDSFQDRITFDTDGIASTADSLGVSEVDISSKEGAQESLAALDSAIEMVSGKRAELGAKQNRLTSTMNNLSTYTESLSAANSRIRDTDYAQETAKNTQLNILNNAGASVLAQSNSQGAAALKLIG
jgi:flagellin